MAETFSQGADFKRGSLHSTLGLLLSLLISFAGRAWRNASLPLCLKKLYHGWINWSGNRSCPKLEPEWSQLGEKESNDIASQGKSLEVPGNRKSAEIDRLNLNLTSTTIICRHKYVASIKTISQITSNLWDSSPARFKFLLPTREKKNIYIYISFSSQYIKWFKRRYTQRYTVQTF